MEQLETIGQALKALQNPSIKPLKQTLARLHLIDSYERRGEGGGYVCVVVYESMVKRRKQKDRKTTNTSLPTHTFLSPPPPRRFLNG
jgi:hypothetical protein